jgi:integrase
MARNHFGPLLDLPVTDISRSVVAAWVNASSAAPKTTSNAHGLLSSVMATCVREGWMPTNPCEGVRLPRIQHHEMRFLDPDEFWLVASLLEPHYRPLAVFLAGTGARFGEATALRAADVDLSEPAVRIIRAWKRTPTGWEIGPPKTRRSVRTVHLPPPLVVELAPILTGLHRDELVFRSRTGQRVWQSNFYDAWRTAAKRSGIEPPLPRVHDLRHSHVALLIRQGVGLAVIQDRLGHESIQTTVNTYGHLESDLRVAAARAAAVLWQPIERGQQEPARLGITN